MKAYGGLTGSKCCRLGRIAGGVMGGPRSDVVCSSSRVVSHFWNGRSDFRSRYIGGMKPLHRSLWLSAFGLVFGLSCTKAPVFSSADTTDFIFGAYPGGGPLVAPPLFRYQDGSLERDTAGLWWHDRAAAAFIAVQYTAVELQQIADLQAQFPTAIWSLPAGQQGCPGCADQLVIYLALTHRGESKHWSFSSPFLTEQSTDLDQYLAAVEDLVERLHR